MKLFKLDTVESVLYLIICIVVPPLFIINLILFLLQTTPKFIANKNNKKIMKELEGFNEINEKLENEKIMISAEDKKFFSEKLNFIASSYLGEDETKILSFLLLILLDKVCFVSILNFIDYLSELDSITPESIKIKEIKEVIDLFNNNYI